MQASRICRWRDWSGTGLEHLILTPSDGGILVESTVLLPEDEGSGAMRYTVRTDSQWRVAEFELAALGGDKHIRLASDGEGHWREEGGVPVPHLDGAIDIDISATPFTNTLPIRRLRLAKGAAQEILAVYVKVPELILSTDRQRYTCIEPLRRYLYEAVDGTFTREIEVDADGLVATYPGLFQRVL